MIDIYMSIIFPAYNESERLPIALEKTVDYCLRNKRRKYEIIVVENGSNDNTFQVAIDTALTIARQPIHNVAIRVDQSSPGKGSALRYGMKSAKGRKVLLTDIDLSTPLREMERLLSANVDVAIGSRSLPSSVVIGRGTDRQLAGRIFNAMTSIVVPGIKDTQCGFKLLTNHAVKQILPYLCMDGFAFDVELLRVARNLGLSIQEVPVVWKHDPQSTVRMIPDSLKMTRDLIKIGYNHAIGRYSD